MTLTPTPEQLHVLSLVRESQDNILISALAGAAKTTTLVLIAEALRAHPMLFLAFNKRIQLEMQERLPGNCTAMTLNGIGHKVWMQAIGKRLTVDTAKNYNLLQATIEELPGEQRSEAYGIMSETLRAIEHGKMCGYLPDGRFRDAKPLVGDDEFFASLEEEPSELQESLIRKVTIESALLSLKGVIDFNDQILMPTCFFGTFPKFPVVGVDEAQDLSALNHVMLRKIVRTSRLIAVGDECQPAGTLVSVVDHVGGRWNPRRIRQVPIEEIKEGDRLVGYDTQYSEFLFNRQVKGVTARPFKGNLIKLVTKKGITKYTPNHHCFANFSRLRKHTALYLMRSGKRWRLGVAAMDYKQASGPIARARAEAADGLWILATFPTKQEALAAEAAVQAAYGIPDITFEWAGVHTNGYQAPKVLKSIWNRLENIDFTERATALLQDFNREVEYPLWSPVKTYATFKRPIIVHACNLLPGGEVLPFVGKKREQLSDWMDYEIRHEAYDGLVYSLSVSHNNLFVADGIVTHNCQSIYGFRGAHEDSMELLAQTFSMKRAELTVSFRCPVAVVKAARFRAPAMQWPEWAKEGNVTTLSEWSVENIPLNATILCRNNAPLFSCAIALLKNGRYPELVGNDIGKNLIKLMKKLGDPGMTAEETHVAIDQWKESKLSRARDKDKFADQAACMHIFVEQGKTLADAIAYAEHLLRQSGTVKLMTGHKSKGLEWPEVFILDQQLINLRHTQERNLLYVMITRAKESLTYITMEGFKGV